MAIYRIGDIIKIKRQALGVSQEELCFGICEQHTLSNIENGKCKVKQRTYSDLMNKLNQYSDKNYGIIRSDNYEMLQITKRIEENIFNREYEDAEELLNILKKNIDMNYNMNKQYIMHIESTINYRFKHIDTNQYYEKLIEAIKLTIPDFDTIKLHDWAFNEREFQILMHLNTVYSENNEIEKAEALLYDLKSALEKKYLDNSEFTNQYTLVVYNLSNILGNKGNHEEAIKLSNQALEICKKNKKTSMVCYLIGDIAWNIEQLIKKGILNDSEEKACLELYEKAYYLSYFRKDTLMINFYKQRCVRKYPDKINLL